MEPLAALDWMIRGGAVTLAALTGGFIAWRGGRLAVRIATPLFPLTTAAYALNAAPYGSDVLGPAKLAAALATHACVGCFWLLAMVLFEDRPLSALLLAPPVILFVVGALGELTPLGANDALWTTFNAVCVALALAVLGQVALSWRDDLIEARRSMRVWFVVAFSVLALLVLVGEFTLPAGEDPSMSSLLFGLGLLAVSVLGVAALTALSPSALLGATKPVERVAAPEQEEAALHRLEAVMGAGEAWRRERLTTKDLAREVGVSEPTLRRLIGERLGFRNFPAFVNVRRVEAAKAALADPTRRRQTIAAIAFDFGFGSLAPFNRAFREHTGLTPTQWRRKAAGAA